MKRYEIKIIMHDVWADDKEHGLEQVQEMLEDQQFSPEITEVEDNNNNPF